jgi:hypothetical protein
MAVLVDGVWSTFFNSLQTILNEYVDVVQSNDQVAQVDMYDSLTRYIRSLAYILELSNNYDTTAYSVQFNTMAQLLADLKVIRCDVMALCGIRGSTEISIISNVASIEENYSPGRPRFNVDRDQVLHLQNLGFSRSTISIMLNISRTTLWRRLNEWGMHRARHTLITDNDLTEIIRNVYTRHVHCGVRMMIGHLRRLGIDVPRQRVREILREIDPANSAIRWGMAIRRRVYSVPCSNFLWHIDTHHGLIRWRLVTAGGIDGFSRLIVYLSISNNNRADTVLESFVRATESYSCPSRVRGDRGVENYRVRDYMNERRGLNRGSFIAGRSCHNSRIERLWRDLMYAVIQTYYSLFYFLEGQNKLDVDSELDLFCLHSVYIPVIKNALEEFRQAYNNHGLSSERGWTPIQMWTNSMIDVTNRSQTHVQELFNADIADYGIDAHAPLAQENEVENEGVHVPDTAVPLDAEQLASLDIIMQNGNRHENYGIDLYLTVRQFTRECLNE